MLTSTLFAILTVTHVYGDLKMVTVVYRHGDRTPYENFPTDPYGEAFWPAGWGQLTPLGMRQEYELGQWLRGRYGGLLPLQYNEKDIYVQSTDYSRALMSAECNLAGLYQPQEQDVWSPGIHWQPIPVRSIPEAYDDILMVSKSCPKYTLLFTDTLMSKDVLGVYEKYNELFKNLTDLTGWSCGPSTWFYYPMLIYDNLFIEELNGLKLPAWTVDYYPHPLEELMGFSFKLFAYNKGLQRLRCGPLLKKILDDFERKINGNLTEKMWQYSAHDMTLANLMQCLGAYDGNRPGYASAVIFELHQESKKDGYYVSIWYKTVTTLKPLVIPGCEEICPIQKLRQLVQSVLPDDWEKECKIA